MRYARARGEYLALVERLTRAERRNAGEDIRRLAPAADRLWSRLLAAYETERRAGPPARAGRSTR